MHLEDEYPPWAHYPKHLLFEEIQNPFTFLRHFFWTFPATIYIEELRKWQSFAISDKAWSDHSGPGGLLFTYDMTVKFMEAAHLWSLDNRFTSRDFGIANEEQIEREKVEWEYFPNDLNEDDIARPLYALEECFVEYQPQNYRDFLYDLLRLALSTTKYEDDDPLSAKHMLTFTDNLRMMYSTVWCMFKRFDSRSTFGPATKTALELEQADSPIKIDKEYGIDFQPFNFTLSKADLLGLNEIKNVILKCVPSVKAIFCLGKTDEDFSYYLAVLVDDNEKKAENDLINRITDNCKILAPIFVLVQKVKTVSANILNERRFWNSVILLSEPVYKAPDLSLPEAKKISDSKWLERAESDWDRWFTQGTDFLKGADRFLADGNFALALFLLHQAAESTLTAIMLVWSGYRVNFHNLKRIVDFSLLFGFEVRNALELDVDEGKEAFSLLQKSYTEARYKKDFKPDKVPAEAVRKMVGQLIADAAMLNQRFVNNRRKLITHE